MGFYNTHIEPRLVSAACGMKVIARERAKVAPLAEGRVLEIGFGSGHNVPYYDYSKITRLFALEPSRAWRRLGEKRIANLPFPVEWLDRPGEEIPLDDQSVDTVLVTFALCTITDVEAALAGMRRVLKPGGKLVFLEHGLAPDPGVARWQNRLNGVWGKLAGGCRLNRDPVSLIRKNGYSLDSVTAHYLPRTLKIAGFVSSGVAFR